VVTARIEDYPPWQWCSWRFVNTSVDYGGLRTKFSCYLLDTSRVFNRVKAAESAVVFYWLFSNMFYTELVTFASHRRQDNYEI
jgi:hypothetical protein